jgi:hypothetical protein
LQSLTITSFSAITKLYVLTILFHLPSPQIFHPLLPIFSSCFLPPCLIFTV